MSATGARAAGGGGRRERGQRRYYLLSPQALACLRWPSTLPTSLPTFPSPLPPPPLRPPRSNPSIVVAPYAAPAPQAMHPGGYPPQPAPVSGQGPGGVGPRQQRSAPLQRPGSCWPRPASLRCPPAWWEASALTAFLPAGRLPPSFLPLPAVRRRPVRCAAAPAGHVPSAASPGAHPACAAGCGGCMGGGMQCSRTPLHRSCPLHC